MKLKLKAQVAFGVLAAAAVLAGCDDNAGEKKNPGQDVECTSNDDCAGRADGKTLCNKLDSVCVSPDLPKECTTNEQCAGRLDGKTQCDTINGVCVMPGVTPKECTTNEQCAGRSDGKTQCDTANGVCVLPGQTPGAVCGDGKIDGEEACDKTDLGGKSCQNWADFVDGTLGCDSTCHFDTTGCVECTDTDTSKCGEVQICSNGHCVDGETEVCGNGGVGEDEDCESGIALTKTCADIDGFVDGTLGCDAVSCTYDTSACIECTDKSQCAADEICENGECVQIKTECGNDVVEGEEKCDGADLNGKSCKDYSEFVDGTLACGKTCDFDTRGCVECTDEDKSKCGKDQVCSDGNCVDPGHKVECGDGKIEGDEECEEGKLNGQTCADQSEGNQAGVLKCTQCKFDTTECLECSTNAHCAGRKDGKVICQDNVCIDPATLDIPKVVISQIYPAGGNNNAKLNTKYVELLNIDDKEVTLSNWSIQYAPASKESLSVCKLPKTVKIPKGGYYLVALNQAGSNGDAIPTPDFTCTDGTLSPAAADGKLFLVYGSEALASAQPTYGYADAVGYGSANWGEGGTKMAKLSTAYAGFRKNKGCVDTDNNADDFERKAPAPRNSKSPLNLCDGSERCDNGTLDSGEDCDGTQFKGNKTACKDWNSNYTSGNVKCSNTCTIDYSNCKTEVPAQCKNGNLETGEDCDGTLFKGNKTACKDWDSSYVAGSVKCSNACTIDYSDCKITLCQNGQLDSGEDCDANQFKGNKVLCKDWNAGKYNKGEVGCKNDCTIDYSECKYVDPTSCLEGQEFFENEDIVACVYPISSKQDLLDLSSKWNAQGKAAYPTNDGEDPVFLLKNDIDMGELTKQNWSQIGSLSNPFEAVFYGDNHTIKASLKSVSGLWKYTSYATIQNFTFQIDATGSAANFLANQVDHGSFKNIIVTGSWKAEYYNTAAYGVFQNIENAVIDNIRVELDAVVERSGDASTSYYVGIFMRSSKSSTLNRISLNGSFATHKDSRSIYLCLLAYESSNDRITNSEINMDVNVLTGDYIDDVNILMYKMDKNTVVDKMNIKKAAVTKHTKDEGHLIDTIGGDCTKCVISNLEDNTVYSTLGNTNLIDIPGNITIVNSLFNGNVTTFMSSIGVIKYVKFVNDIFIKFTGLSETPALKQDVYFKADIDNKTITAAKMNQNLADKKENIPSGTYLPWKQDSKDRFYLKFDASDTEVYVIP